ncbi:MAG: hypothetical protein KC547_00595 [Anaerolineae bacterium]|nr:hypothetical protein [Anaerolineae bacterium]MCA9909195.1 hypothetical protein [Anaerolineae bacterium]
MDDNPTSPGAFDDPEWLEEFQELANRALSELDDSASCEQVHPIIASWYEKLMQGEPPDSRDSILQAMACLSSEIMNQVPDDAFEDLMEFVSEDELAGWIEYILMVGRAFEIALRNGQFDDL